MWTPEWFVFITWSTQEYGEMIKSALRREINEETGLKVEIHDPVEEWVMQWIGNTAAYL